MTVTWVLQVSERSVYYLKLRYLLFNLRTILNHTLNFRFFQKKNIKFLGCVLYTGKYGISLIFNWSDCSQTSFEEPTCLHNIYSTVEPDLYVYQGEEKRLLVTQNYRIYANIPHIFFPEFSKEKLGCTHYLKQGWYCSASKQMIPSHVKEWSANHVLSRLLLQDLVIARSRQKKSLG